MNSELRIRTPEGIAFAYQLAGPVARCMAWGCDLVVILALSIGVGRLCAVFGLISADFAAALSTVALAAVSPGTYTPNAGSFDSANAPGSSHLKSGSASCTS